MDAKACFYSLNLSKYMPQSTLDDQAESTDNQVMLVGGWQNASLCKQIDLWNADKMTLKQNWKGMQLKVGDMVTKRIVFNSQTNTAVVLGRKALHFVDLNRFETQYIAELGEDGAEASASKFNEACKAFED
jgi:hypothetical protein